MTLELVPWRGATVPLLHGPGNGVSRSFVGIDQYAAWLNQFGGSYFTPPPPTTLYGQRPAEPISYSFQGFVEGMLYADSPVAAVEAYRLRVFSQAPLLYQQIVDGRPGKFADDEALDALREPWPGGTLSDLMKRSLVYGDFAGNAFIVDVEDELVVLRPDWVLIVLEPRTHNGGQVGWRQKGIIYYERGLNQGDGVTFLPGEYAHFIPGLPDPLACYRGMSWLTPLVREVKADKSAGDHKLAFFENSASPNLAISLPKEITPEQFKSFVAEMDAQHKGAAQAGKTLYTAGGADVTLIGANMQQADFSSVVGKGETRIAANGGVPPVLLSFSEGMQGSSLNAGNYTAAKRNFVDTTMRDLWSNWCGSLAQMDRFKPGKRTKRLWYDGRDIPFLHEDAKDLADIQSVQATAINQHITAGFEPSSARDAVEKDDLGLLVATGMVSVQLAPPGQGAGAQSGSQPSGQADGTSDGPDGSQPGDSVARAFNRGQLRAPNGRWIDMGLLKKIGDEARKSIRGSSTTVDWRGVHVTVPVRGRMVTATVSPLDIASIALLAVPGPNVAVGSVRAARALLVVGRIRKALAAARVAEGVAGAISTARRSQDDDGEYSFDLLDAEDAGVDFDLERGHPYPGQHYHHGWVPVSVAAAAEVLTPDEAARDYGDELDRVSVGDASVVARSEGTLTIQSDLGDAATIHAAPSPQEAQSWADYIDDGLDLSEGETTAQDGLLVLRTADGLSLRWPEGGEDIAQADLERLDGVDLSDDEVPDFTAALRDMAYVTDDHQNVPDEPDVPDLPGDETPIPDAARAVDPKHPHYGKGVAGGKGGQFRPLADRIAEALSGWLDGGGVDADPLKGFSQPQLKKAAEQLGLNPPKGMRLVPLKGLLMAHGRVDKGLGAPGPTVTHAGPSDKVAALVASFEGDSYHPNVVAIVSGDDPHGRWSKDDHSPEANKARATELRRMAKTARDLAGMRLANSPGHRPGDDVRRKSAQDAIQRAENLDELADALDPPAHLKAIVNPKPRAAAKKAATVNAHPDLRPDGSANASKVRQSLLGMDAAHRQAYLEGLTSGMNQTKVRALAKDLGIKSAGRADHETTVGLILDHFDPSRKRLSTGGTAGPGVKAADFDITDKRERENRIYSLTLRINDEPDAARRAELRKERAALATWKPEGSKSRPKEPFTYQGESAAAAMERHRAQAAAQQPQRDRDAAAATAAADRIREFLQSRRGDHNVTDAEVLRIIEDAKLNPRQTSLLADEFNVVFYDPSGYGRPARTKAERNAAIAEAVARTHRHNPGRAPGGSPRTPAKPQVTAKPETSANKVVKTAARPDATKSSVLPDEHGLRQSLRADKWTNVAGGFNADRREWLIGQTKARGTTPDGLDGARAMARGLGLDPGNKVYAELLDDILAEVDRGAARPNGGEGTPGGKAAKPDAAKVSADFADAVKRPMPSDRDRFKAELGKLTGAQLADIATAHGAKLPPGTKQAKADFLVETLVGFRLNSESIRHGMGSLSTYEDSDRNKRLAEITAAMQKADLRGDRAEYGRLHQLRVDLDKDVGQSKKVAKSASAPAAIQPRAVTRDQIMQAYSELASHPGDLVSLVRLRDRMKHVDHDELTATLKEMDRERLIQLDPDPNRKALPDEAKAAAILLGGDPKHFMSSLGYSSPKA